MRSVSSLAPVFRGGFRLGHGPLREPGIMVAHTDTGVRAVEYE